MVTAFCFLAMMRKYGFRTARSQINGTKGKWQLMKWPRNHCDRLCKITMQMPLTLSTVSNKMYPLRVIDGHRHWTVIKGRDQWGSKFVSSFKLQRRALTRFEQNFNLKIWNTEPLESLMFNIDREVHLAREHRGILEVLLFQSINQSKFYSDNIPGEARLSGPTAKISVQQQNQAFHGYQSVHCWSILRPDSLHTSLMQPTLVQPCPRPDFY